MDVKKYSNGGLKFCLPGGELVFSKNLVITMLIQLGTLGFIALYSGIVEAIMTFFAFCVLFGIFHSIGFLQVRAERIRDGFNFKRKI
jgi:hypothetical protein